VEVCRGHRHKAAGILGISERSLYRKLKEYGMAESTSVAAAG